MKLTVGWWKARDGSKWHVDWVGDRLAVGHIPSGLSVGKWSDAGFVGAADSPYDLLAPWTEAKLRPWNSEEVPDCWLMHKRQSRVRYKPIFVNEARVLVACINKGCSQETSLQSDTFENLFKNYEHSIDGGKTWHPCGVVEEQQ